MGKRNRDEKLKIAVIGTGLIGCSMADGLRSVASEITGVDNNAGHLQQALSRGIIDRSTSLDNALIDSGLVIVTVPVDATITLLPEILDKTAQQTIVIDAGSVKSAVCRSVTDHPARSRFVAAHPMAGLAVSGPDSADSLLFRGRSVIVCEHERSSSVALDTASMVFDLLGMRMIFMDPEMHDARVSRISHLPQIIAYCLSALAEGREDEDSLASIASTGFESSTRLASSPSDMWIPIFQHNSEKLISSLGEMITLLADARDMMRKGQWESLTRLIEMANKARERFLKEYK